MNTKQTNNQLRIPHLWRDDGERFSRNEDGTYSMDNSDMDRPYRYSFGRLMDTGAFSVYPVERKKK